MRAITISKKEIQPAIQKNGLNKSVKGKKRTRNVAESYDRAKDYEGKFYTGMQVGRSHKWYYDKGEWKETKITPDLWQLHYAVKKRRAGKAPEGSGVPVGSGYHWFIVAHQIVKKLNADDYTTVMTGMKYKLSHKNVSKDTWSNSSSLQREHLIEFL